MAHRKKSLGRRLASLFLLKIPLAFIALSLLWVLVLKWVPVTVTPLMVQRSIEFRKDDSFKTKKDWKPLEKISVELPRAVIASEDNRFLDHKGFDWVEIENALEEHKEGRRTRGASTISQQTAKNVFLIPSRTLVRKAFEAWFTVLIEAIWGKERIMEVYLNVAEMGKGIYGAEAAAMEFYGHGADQLTRRESCLIAACLPNPLERNAAKPSSYVSSRAGKIASLEGKLSWPDWLKSGKRNP